MGPSAWRRARTAAALLRPRPARRGGFVPSPMSSGGLVGRDPGLVERGPGLVERGPGLGGWAGDVRPGGRSD